MRFRSAPACIGLVLLAACDRQAAPPPVFETPPDDVGALAIGVVLDLTGPRAPETAAALRALREAVERCNGSGGIRGRRAELHVLDDRGRAAESLLAARRLREETLAVILVTEAAADARAGGERRAALESEGLPVAAITDVGMLLAALERAGDYRPATIAQALESVRGRAGSGP